MRKFNCEPFKKPNNRFSFLLIFFEWAIVLLSGYLSVRWYWFWPFCIILFGRAQLILDNISHYAGHRTLFKQRILNDALSFFYFYPVFTTIVEWYDEHKKHHQKLGGKDDPGMQTYFRWKIKEYGLFRAFLFVPFSEFRINFRLLNISRSLGLCFFWVGVIFSSILFGFWWPVFLWLVSFFTSRMYFIFISEVGEHYNAVENHGMKWKLGSRIFMSYLVFLFKYPWDALHWFHHEFPKIPLNNIVRAFEQYKKEGFLVPKEHSFFEILKEAK